jgi:hypothetical protein
MAARLHPLGWIGSRFSAIFPADMRANGVDRPLGLADPAREATEVVCAMRAAVLPNILQRIFRVQERCAGDCWPRKPEFGGAPGPRYCA